MTDLKKLLNNLRKQKLKLATAESCTGGMIASRITNIPGSSDVFEGGFVTYSNIFKEVSLNVSRETLSMYGAVSKQVAREMVIGALRNSEADIAIATTGIAGPGGGSKEKPVGLVYIAVGDKNRIKTIKLNLKGTRKQIREEATERALELVKDFLN